MNCPRCHRDNVEVHTEFKWGYLNLIRYEIGDEIEWAKKGRMNRGARTESERIIHGYSECRACLKDFWTAIQIKNNRIVGMEVNHTKPPLIPDDNA